MRLQEFHHVGNCAKKDPSYDDKNSSREEQDLQDESNGVVAPYAPHRVIDICRVLCNDKSTYYASVLVERQYVDIVSAVIATDKIPVRLVAIHRCCYKFLVFRHRHICRSSDEGPRVVKNSKAREPFAGDEVVNDALYRARGRHIERRLDALGETFRQDLCARLQSRSERELLLIGLIHSK